MSVGLFNFLFHFLCVARLPESVYKALVWRLYLIKLWNCTFFILFTQDVCVGISLNSKKKNINLIKMTKKNHHSDENYASLYVSTWLNKHTTFIINSWCNILTFKEQFIKQTEIRNSNFQTVVCWNKTDTAKYY